MNRNSNESLKLDLTRLELLMLDAKTDNYSRSVLRTWRKEITAYCPESEPIPTKSVPEEAPVCPYCGEPIGGPIEVRAGKYTDNICADCGKPFVVKLDKEAGYEVRKADDRSYKCSMIACAISLLGIVILIIMAVTTLLI